MKELKVRQVIQLLNILDLIGICLIIFVAFILQILLHELPCPLCLLQRLGLLAVGFGFLLNVRYKIRPAHYSLSLLAAVFTGFVAMRQMALHLLPGVPGYGDTLFGLHLYTWVFIVSVLIIIYIAIIQGVPGQYHAKKAGNQRWVKILSHAAFLFLVSILALNIISGIAECGFKECPDNPVSYTLFVHNKYH